MSSSTLSESLSRLQQLLADDQLEDVVSLCQELTTTTTTTEISPNVLATILEIWVKGCLHLDDLDGAWKVLDQMDELDSTPPTTLALRAYIHYRRKDYKRVVATLEGGGDGTMDTTAQLLLAQSYYRLHRTQQAQELYQTLLPSSSLTTTTTTLSEEERVQTLTNALAVAISNGSTSTSTPSFLSSSFLPLQEAALAILNDDDKKKKKLEDDLSTYPYELAYNLATLQTLTLSSAASSTTSATARLLETAKQAAMEQEGADSKEVLAIDINTRMLQNAIGGAPSDQAALSSSSVSSYWALMHAALDAQAKNQVRKAYQLYPKTMDPTVLTTPLQQRLYCWNKGILALRAKKFEEALEATQQLLQSLSLSSSSSLPSNNNNNNNSAKKKKKKKGTAAATATTAPTNSSVGSIAPPPTQDETIWWRTRVIVLKANVLMAQQQPDQGSGVQDSEAISLLRQHEEELSGLLSSSTKTDGATTSGLEYALALTRLWKAQLLGQLEGPEQKLQVLENVLLPLSSIGSKPSVMATKAALLQKLNRPVDENLLSLQEGSKELADFWFSQGHYEKAADLYAQQLQQQKHSGTDADASCQLQRIQALSYFDMDQAQQEWDALGLDGNFDKLEDVDADALEEGGIPRVLSTATAASSSSSTGAMASSGASGGEAHDKSKKKKSHEAIMRRRARKRQEYMENHPDARKPDPERWLPKYERSGRRKHNRQRHNNSGVTTRGHQGGGVSENDAAKLDIAARLAGDSAGGGGTSSAGPSTAHINVSSSSSGNTKRKGGRRR